MADKAKTREVPILRDSTFFRATADNAVIISLGRDSEIAFLATSPVPRANSGTFVVEGSEASMAGIRVESAIFEVARLRMAPESLITLALQIVLRSIENGETTINEFSNNLRLMDESNLPSNEANEE